MHFEKVCFTEFYESLKNQFHHLYSDDEIKGIYDKIKLPHRATQGSYGYDFYCPVSLNVIPKNYYVIPTGIRWVCDTNGYSLLLLPRSGQGFKYGVRLRNTVGLIDSDYVNSNNWGHIMCKLSSDEMFCIKQGQAFMQGLILRCYTCDDDLDELPERCGGFGSTDRI